MIHHQNKQELTSNDSGFTIIESLMAIVVVSILMVAIAPAIVLSVATRVQAKRVELATDAASSYIDAVRSATIVPPAFVKKNDIKDPEPVPPDAPSGTLKCDNSSDYCTSPSLTTSSLFCVNGDSQDGCQNTSNKDMVVQAFGYHPKSTNAIPTKPEDGYKLVVRVYRADAFKTGITLKAAKDGVRADKTFGVNILSPGKPQPPLVEFPTEVTAKATSFSDLCGRLEDKDSSGNSVNKQSKC
jgi:prepilin-type N-terminal cleavage/methylation domain-containing protein